MESLYGFKEKDVKALAEFLKSRKNQPLTEVFKAYALMSGKKEGTVRNLYYAMAKKSGESEEFRKKYSLLNPPFYLLIFGGSSSSSFTASFVNASIQMSWNICS